MVAKGANKRDLTEPTVLSEASFLLVVHVRLPTGALFKAYATVFKLATPPRPFISVNAGTAAHSLLWEEGVRITGAFCTRMRSSAEVGRLNEDAPSIEDKQWADILLSRVVMNPNIHLPRDIKGKPEPDMQTAKDDFALLNTVDRGESGWDAAPGLTFGPVEGLEWWPAKIITFGYAPKVDKDQRVESVRLLVDRGAIPGPDAKEEGRQGGYLQRYGDVCVGMSGGPWVVDTEENEQPLYAGSLSSSDDLRGAVKKELTHAFAYGPRFGTDLLSRLRVVRLG